MRQPDFAHTDLSNLEYPDLRFILDIFPQHGQSYEEIARLLHTLPNTVESALSSEFLFRQIFDRQQEVLEISPFLFFSVLLRRSWHGRPSGIERKVVNYLANLLCLFIRTDRLYRVQSHDRHNHEYIVGLIEEAQNADSRRQFLIHSHIGNYAMFLTGIFPRWIEYRHRFKHRPVDINTYVGFGSGYYQQASKHALAKQYGLDGVFLRMSMQFDSYRSTLNNMAHRFLPA